jgi:hypothetical protein
VDQLHFRLYPSYRGDFQIDALASREKEEIATTNNGHRVMKGEATWNYQLSDP